MENKAPSMPKHRSSARELLLKMPEVFSVAEFAMVAERPRTEASNYLWRFSKSGQVLGLGGKSGIFLNLVKAPEAPEAASDGALWERAVLKAMPSALTGGHQVLADSGLSTQVTHQRYLIVSNTDAMFDIAGAELHRRPLPWLKRLFAHDAVEIDAPGQTLPRLKPGAALADLALHGAACPDPDDIDLYGVEAPEVALFSRLAKGSRLLIDLEPQVRDILGAAKKRAQKSPGARP